MAVVRPFKALRPVPDAAAQVAALPYDVMSSAEARLAAKDNPLSFLHVDKAEIDLPETADIYDPLVYHTARQNLLALESAGVLVQDTAPCYYLYRLEMNGRAQLGLVACTSIDDYTNDIIKKHEFTRADKEADRIRHVDSLNANTGPIFLAYRPLPQIDTLLQNWAHNKMPVYDFTAPDGVRHSVWVVDDTAAAQKIQAAFADAQNLYIADGHHRAASAVKVGLRRRKENPAYTGKEEFNFFLSVLFPADQLYIMDYNRVVHDLNQKTKAALLEELQKHFLICNSAQPVQPQATHTFGMFVQGEWFGLQLKGDAIPQQDPVAALDVSLLQNLVLSPLLGIDDPRTDTRIEFVGGIRGLKELEARAGNNGVAFSLHPVSMEELMTIADHGQVMPPKSTWFEPKLRSGLFIHKLR